MASTDFERLNIVLAARDREFTRAMERNTRRVERFTRTSNKNLSSTTKNFAMLARGAAALLPALTAGAALAKARQTVATLDEIGKTADRIGLTTDALQELRAAAESAGIGSNTLDMSMQRFGRRIAEARMGTGEAKAVLKELGVELTTAGGAAVPLEDVLGQVADKMSTVAGQTDRNRIAMKLFDTEGVAMVNLLREGSKGMAQMRANAQALGIVVDESLIRQAEGAQTQLDLMGRVIRAQLNTALIELAPLLVGAATTAADFARMIASAANVVSDFLDPQTDLEIATDNLVAAMGDEIRQSQLLEVALNNGITMSEAMARQKLKEAAGRYANVKAIIEENRAQALASDTYGNLVRKIETAQDAMQGLQGSKVDEPARGKAEVYYQLGEDIANWQRERGRLLDVDKRLQDQLARAEQNVKTLEAGVAGASGGVVKLNGGTVTPVDASERKATGGSRGVRKEVKATLPELSNYKDLLDRVNGTFKGAQVEAGDYASVLDRVEHLYKTGQLSAAEYKTAMELVGDEFEEVKATAERMEQATEDMFASIVTGSKSGREALSDLLGTFAQMAAQSAFQGLFGGLFDGVVGAFGGGAKTKIKSFDGGGDTGGGSRSGGLDGKGGYMAMIHPRETVVDHTKGQSAAGGANITVHQSNSFQTDVQQAVRAEMKSYAPQLIEITKSAVADQARRSPSYKRSF